MLYEEYEKKVRKFVRIRDVLYRFRIAILSSLAAVIVVSGSLVSIKGIPVQEQVPGTTFVYGEDFAFSSKAIFGTASMEYSPLKEERWSSEVPFLVGEYRARSVSRNNFGGSYYGKIHSFAITPKESTITLEESSIVYGEAFHAQCALAEGDHLVSFKAVPEKEGQLKVPVSILQKSVSVENRDGSDRTQNYLFKTPAKTVTFLPRPISLSISDASKIYDGKSLTSNDYFLSSGTLAEGDALLVNFQSSRLEPGSSENLFQAKITSKSGVDVTSMYEISTSRKGSLLVKQRPLKVTSKSASKVYDGLPLLADEIALEGTLLDGERVVPSFSSHPIHAGSYQNAFSLQVLDAEGKDVSGHYALTLEPGNLKITPRGLVITFSSSESVHVYDAQTLTPAYSYQPDLLAGDVLEMHYSPLGPNQGNYSIEDLKGYAVIKDGQGAEHTEDYAVSYGKGFAISITPAPLKIAFHSASKVYDAFSLTEAGYDILEGTLYPSEGETPKVSFATPSLHEVGTYTPTVNDLEVKITSKSGLDLTQNYALDIQPGTLTITARPLHLKSLAASMIYAGVPQSSLTYEIVDGTSLASSDQTLLVTAETAPWFVGLYANPLHAEVVGVTDPKQSFTKNYDIQWMNQDEKNLTIHPYSLHIQVQEVLRQTLSKYYDGLPLSVPSDLNLATSVAGLPYLSFESGYALQSNDRIDYSSVQISFAPDSSDQVADVNLRNQLTEKGAYSFSLSKPKFIHRDKEGIELDVTSCYEVTYTGSMICQIMPRWIDLVSSNASKEYDGTSLTSTDFSTRLTSISSANPPSIYTSKWPSGTPFVGQHRIVSTGQTTLPSTGVDVGTYVNSFNPAASFQVLNEANEDRSYDYHFNFCPEGVLTITPRKIAIATPSGQKTYDGNPLVLTNATITSGSLALGQSISFAPAQSAFVAGTYDNLLTAHIVDLQGKETTSNYDITWTYGKLTINQRPIEITTPSVNFTFSGSFQTGGTPSITSGSLAGDDSITGKTAGIKFVGQTENSFVKDTPIITHKDGTLEALDVSSSYLITYVYGSLTMNPLPINLSLYNYESVYDGETTVVPSDCLYLNGGNPLPKGYQLILELAISTPEAGVYRYQDSTSNPKVKILDENKTEVPMENFIVTYLETGNALTLKKRPLVIMTLSGSKVFDGKPFPSSILKPIPIFGTLVAGQTLDIGLGGMESVVEVGKYTNAIGEVRILNKEGTNVADSSYDIQKIEGTLTIKAEA